MAGAGNPNANVYNASASAMSGAVDATRGAMAGPDIGAFMNPYTSMVTGQTMNDLERQRQMAGNTMSSRAASAGAFGGSRHGVADALTNEAFARQGAQTFADLNMQGFNTALGAAQDQQQIGLAGGAQLGNLGSAGFNMGQQISADQRSIGETERQIMDTLYGAAAGQFGGYTGYGMDTARNIGGILSMTQPGQTTTETTRPGLLQLLTAFA